MQTKFRIVGLPAAQFAPLFDLCISEIPELVSIRTLSVRAYDNNSMMIDCAVVAGSEIKPHIEKLFADPDIAYLHLHNAAAGCYSCKVERA